MRAVFLDRDGTLTKGTGLIVDESEIELEGSAADAIKILNEAGFMVVVITNQPQIARGLCTESDVERINEKMVQDISKNGAKVDAVYYCPHHPEMHPDVPEHARKYRIVCDCRKPGTGMLKKAAKDHNIDLSHSFFIGDSTMDILAGKNAGCKTILVKTGYGGKDKKHDIIADYEATDIGEAARLIKMMKTKAIILVGGKGERLGELTKDIPKPLIKIAGKSVVEHQIDLLKKSGVRSFVLCGSYMIDKIKYYFGNGERFGIDIEYTDEPEPLGTGGAVKLAESVVHDYNSVIVSNGDIMLRDVDFYEIMKYHRSKHALVTMVVRDSDHPKDSDIVKIDESGRIVEFIGKGQEKYTTGNTGMFIADINIFKFIPSGKSNIERDVLSKIFSKERVFGFKIKEGWIVKDMGTPDRLESLRKLLGD